MPYSFSVNYNFTGVAAVVVVTEPDLQSPVRIPAAALPSATLGKLLTHMCLCHQAV